MREITVTPILEKSFGAIITNVRLAELDDATFASIKAAFLEFGFLLFPDQHLTEAQNIQFGERFGSLEFGALPMANQEKHEDGSYGRVFDLASQRMRTNVGNEIWHTDSTYWPISSKCAMLSAVTVPDSDGETELADMRAGYAALDKTTQQKIADLSAYHSTQYSQANDVGDFPPQKPGTIYHGEAYLRPLVKTHPETGVKNLFIGRHAFGIPTLSRQQSRALLEELLAIVVSDPARVYTHKWQVGDTLIWDNRALLHRARPYDYAKPRVLTATRVAGEKESELAYYPDDPAAAAGRQALASELSALRTEVAGKKFGTDATSKDQASAYPISGD
ncbi:MAG: alpha-ketoglutarate-dependent taurine dioxygenase [Candidatus Azotimanducaceae bacterium]|jgi:alpha-ketoglutarate-dependent taurine dioxygenase